MKSKKDSKVILSDGREAFLKYIPDDLEYALVTFDQSLKTGIFKVNILDINPIKS